MSLLVPLQQKHIHCHTLAGDLFKDDTSLTKSGSCLDRKGSFRHSKGSSLSGRKKEMGKCVHSEFVMEKPAGSMNFLVPAGKKTKNLYHRLGTCYNFSANTHSYA